MAKPTSAEVGLDGRSTPSPLASYFPGYFAMVMATGIIAIGCRSLAIPWLGEVLYVVAAVAYVVIAVLTTARLVRYPRLVTADITSHAKGFAFTTAVAGTEVLGTASLILFGWWQLALVLWWVGVGLWVMLVYTTLIAVVLCAEKPGFAAGINGTWFLLTVATESIAVLGALLLPRVGGEALAFTCLAFFCLGILLYVIVMTMIFARWTFYRLSFADEDPPIWIAAGAVAITALAGSNLLLAGSEDPLLESMAPAIALFVVLAWATSTFWFPLMVAIGVWKHVVNRIPVHYHPSFWALVFPLGMYAVATFKMRLAINLGMLAWLSVVALAIALVAWTATFFGLLHHVMRATTAG